jgi:nucleoside-diphosphate-sugar epimerase
MKGAEDACSVTGASGGSGSRLVPQLRDGGHEVVGTHNAPASAEPLRTLGAKPAKLDLLDVRAVRKAVLESEPETIVHDSTALASAKFSRNFDKTDARTDELSDGLDVLRDAPAERRAVVVEMSPFAEFLLEQIPRFWQEWEARREALVASGDLPEERPDPRRHS